jgi:hypothetical protein
MKQEAYSYYQIDPKKYRFTSIGKSEIVKLVDFTATGHPNIYNLAFGDLLANDKVDDQTISDNGDMTKIFATVIQIIMDFTAKYPFLKIFFSGSTPVRTNLYSRILKMYYHEFKGEFIITALIREGTDLEEVAYNPLIFKEYVAFFVKRKT